MVKDAVKGALATAKADFEWNEAKWKAKCYIYRLSGCAVFSVRLYTREGGGGEEYIVELQRRKVRRVFGSRRRAVMCGRGEWIGGSMHPLCDCRCAGRPRGVP